MADNSLIYPNFPIIRQLSKITNNKIMLRYSKPTLKNHNSAIYLADTLIILLLELDEN